MISFCSVCMRRKVSSTTLLRSVPAVTSRPSTRPITSPSFTLMPSSCTLRTACVISAVWTRRSAASPSSHPPPHPPPHPHPPPAPPPPAPPPPPPPHPPLRLPPPPSPP